MFSIEPDPLTECFLKVIATYPKTDEPAPPDGTFFSEVPAETSKAVAALAGDLADRLVVLAGMRGGDVDRGIVAATVGACEREPLIIEMMPWHYTIA